MKKAMAVIVLMALAGGVSAEEWTGQAAAYLDLPAGARPLGLGGAIGSLGGDPLYLHGNPASLAELEQTAVEFSYSDRTLGRRHAQLALGLPPMNRLHLGLLANLYSVSDIPGMNASGDPTDSYNNTELALSVGCGTALGQWFRAGVAGRFYTQSLSSNSAKGMGFDVGVQFVKPMSGGSMVRIGVSATHLGASLKWNTSSQVEEEIPNTYRAAISYELPMRVRTLLAYDYIVRSHGGPEQLFGSSGDTGRGLSHACGLELWPHPILALRTGVMFDDSLGFDSLELDEMAFGASILWRKFRMDYAYRVDPIAGRSSSTVALRI